MQKCADLVESWKRAQNKCLLANRLRCNRKRARQFYRRIRAREPLFGIVSIPDRHPSWTIRWAVGLDVERGPSSSRITQFCPTSRPLSFGFFGDFGYIWAIRSYRANFKLPSIEIFQFKVRLECASDFYAGRAASHLAVWIHLLASLKQKAASRVSYSAVFISVSLRCLAVVESNSSVGVSAMLCWLLLNQVIAHFSSKHSMQWVILYPSTSSWICRLSSWCVFVDSHG